MVSSAIWEFPLPDHRMVTTRSQEHHSFAGSPLVCMVTTRSHGHHSFAGSPLVRRVGEDAIIAAIGAAHHLIDDLCRRGILREPAVTYVAVGAVEIVRPVDAAARTVANGEERRGNTAGWIGDGDEAGAAKVSTARVALSTTWAVMLPLDVAKLGEPGVPAAQLVFTPVKTIWLPCVSTTTALLELADIVGRTTPAGSSSVTATATTLKSPRSPPSPTRPTAVAGWLFVESVK